MIKSYLDEDKVLCVQELLKDYGHVHEVMGDDHVDVQTFGNFLNSCFEVLGKLHEKRIFVIMVALEGV